MQQILTVLREVGDVQKIFSYDATHALVFRADDVDLQWRSGSFRNWMQRRDIRREPPPSRARPATT